MTTETVFNNITAPLQTILKKEADQLHGDSLLYKLSLYFFNDEFGLRHYQKNSLYCPLGNRH
jgi:hypothetical protein